MCTRTENKQLRTKITESAKLIDDLTFEDIEFLKDEVRLLHAQETADLIIAFIDLSLSTREAFEKNRRTLISLLKGLFGSKTENIPKPAPKNTGNKNTGKKEEKTGHGPNSAKDTPATEEIDVEIDDEKHEELQLGENCPECLKGKIVKAKPSVFLRFLAQLPILIKKYIFHNRRCSLCGKVFRPEAPEGMGEEKYDAAVKAILIQFMFEAGVPAYRMEKLFKSWGIKLSDATLWDIVNKEDEAFTAIYEELKKQIAQAPNLYADDTSNKILEKPKEKKNSKKKDKTSADEKKVRSLKSTVVIGESAGPKGNITIGIFATNDKSAGREVEEVLLLRDENLPPPFFMADALSANNLKETQVDHYFGACNVHARRKFWNIRDFYPELCDRVLKSFAKIYRFEKYADEHNLSSWERYRLRWIHSRSVFLALKKWFEYLAAKKAFEPNDRFGEAVSYFNRHFARLILFTEVLDAPLDNNISERAIKHVVLKRKVSMFFKSPQGAKISDMLISLIYTCNQNEVLTFEYLRAIIENKDEVKRNPAEWLPWNFRSNLKPQQKSEPEEKQPEQKVTAA